MGLTLKYIYSYYTAYVYRVPCFNLLKQFSYFVLSLLASSSGDWICTISTLGSSEMERLPGPSRHSIMYALTWGLPPSPFVPMFISVMGHSWHAQPFVPLIYGFCSVCLTLLQSFVPTHVHQRDPHFCRLFQGVPLCTQIMDIS